MSDERDLIARLADQLTAAAERQAAEPRGWRRWMRRRPSRALTLIGAGVALAGAGGATALFAPRGEVGGPPTLTFARLSPEQRAVGLEELTRPIVIGRGTLPETGRDWQLVAFQTTRGLCISVDFPRERGIGGGCGTDRPQAGRVVDWQGHLAALGRTKPVILVGAVSPRVAEVRVAHGYAPKGRREIVRARIVHVDDPRVLAHLEIERPFAYYVAELTGDVILAKAVAFDAAGRRLGAMGVPNGGAGSAGFSVPERPGCERPAPIEPRPRDARIPLPRALREGFAVLARPQRPDDRPPAIVRQLTTGVGAVAYGTIDLASVRRIAAGRDSTGRGGQPLYLFVHTGRDWKPRHECLRTTTPRRRAIERRLWRALERSARTPRLSLVDAGGISIAGADPAGLWRPRGYNSRGFLRSELPAYARRRGGKWSLISGLIPDGVATVELEFRGGLRRTVAVRDNHFQVFVPLGAARADVTRQVWRGADGRVLYRRGG